MTKKIGGLVSFLAVIISVQAFGQQSSITNTLNAPAGSVSSITHSPTVQVIPKEPLMDAVDEAMEKDDYPTAIKLLRQYLARNPNDKNAIFELIRAYTLNNNFDLASKLLSNNEAKYGQDKVFLMEKARYFAMNNQSQAALAIIEPLLQQDPSNSELIEIKNYVLTQKSKPLDPLIAAANNASENNDNLKAIALYIQYLDKNPDDKDAMLDLIRLESQQENYAVADKLLTHYQSKFGQDDAFLIEKARYYALSDQPKEAWAILKPLLKKYPKSEQLVEIKQYLEQNQSQPGAAAPSNANKPVSYYKQAVEKIKSWFGYK